MESTQRPIVKLPSEVAEAAMDLVSSLIPTSALSFYFIDPHMHLKGFVGVNIDSRIEKEYQSEFWHLDPLNPLNFEGRSETVVSVGELMPRRQWLQTIFYQDFMKPRGFSYCADMFFRNEGKIIAALVSTREKDLGDYGSHELDLLRGAQRFIEFSLNRIYLPPRLAERDFVDQKYNLTRRELDVLECAMTGLSNKAMCEELGLGLPTLRTHLGNLFEKVGVGSSNELIARIFRELVERENRIEIG